MTSPQKTKKRKQKWDVGSVFSVEQLDGYFCLGQVVDLMVPNAPSCAFYDVRFRVGTMVPPDIELVEPKIIASLSTTREQLDRGYWRVVTNQPPALEQKYWPNEHLRSVGWVGAKTYGSGIVTDFLNAFYGLFPWDYYLDPKYFDELLYSKTKKPTRLVLKAKAN